MCEENIVLYQNGEYRVVFGGRLLKPAWLSPGPATSALDQLVQGKGVVSADGSIQWLPEAHPYVPQEDPLQICKKAVHDISNLMQAVLGFMELGEIERAKQTARDAARHLLNLRNRLK